MKEYRLLPIFLVLLLTACTAAPTPSPSPASTATLTPSPTTTLTPTAAGTPTPTEEPTDTPEPTNLPRPTPAPRSPITFEQENGLPPGAIARLGRGKFLSVDLSPDGLYLATGRPAGITVYDALTLEELWFRSTGDHVDQVTISPDGALIAGAVRDEVAIWNIQTGEQLHVLGKLDGDIQTMSWSPDSSRLFAGSYIGDPYYDELGARDVVPFNTMLVWDIGSGDLLYNLRAPDEKELIEQARWRSRYLCLFESEWSLDGRYLVVGVSDIGAVGEWLLWWDMDSGEHAGTQLWYAPNTGNYYEYEDAENHRLSIHPEQNILAAPSNGSVLFLDLETGQPLDMLPGMDEELFITGVSWPQQTGPFLTASHEEDDNTDHEVVYSDTFQVWDLETGENTFVFNRPDFETYPYLTTVYDFRLSPSGSNFAVAYYGDWVKVWDTQTGVERLSLEEAGPNLLWFPGGQKLITHSAQGISVWDMANGDLLGSIETHLFMYSIDWSPDGSTIAVGTIDRAKHNPMLDVWDVASSQLIQSIEIEDEEIYGPILAVDYAPTSSNIAIGMGSVFGHGAFGTLDPASQTSPIFEEREDNILRRTDTETVWDIVWSPDGTQIAVALNGTVHLLDGGTGDIIDTFEGVSYSVNWSPDSKSIITRVNVEERGEVQIIDIETGEVSMILNTDDQVALDYAWSPNGKIIAISTGTQLNDLGHTYLFDTQTGETIKILSVPEIKGDWPGNPEEYPMTGVVWLDDQTIVTSTGAAPHETFANGFSMGNYGGTILIWDVETGEMLIELEGHNGEVQDLALSPDGSILASASADGTIILWDVAQIMAMIEE